MSCANRVALSACGYLKKEYIIVQIPLSHSIYIYKYTAVASLQQVLQDSADALMEEFTTSSL